jgi:hypothetical protein
MQAYGAYSMELMIAEIGIRQDAEGRYCLNDLHRASGGEAKHKPSEWLRNKQTIDLVAELEIAGIPAIDSKQQVGTFVMKELVYSYAMWISPSFNLKVIRAYDQMHNKPTPLLSLEDPASMRKYLLFYVDKVLELQPKADVFDRLNGADTNINIRNAAKALKIKEHDFVKWLQLNGWVYRNKKGRLEGYSSKVPRYIEHKVHPIPIDGDSDRVSLQVMITAEGLVKLADIFNVELRKAA